MKCENHVYTPLYRSPFHVVRGAEWAVEYCRCGAPQWHLVNPNTGKVLEDQPAYVTHAVPRPFAGRVTA
jgi:hypothetical protein